MTKFWLKDGKIVCDGSGHPILCDTCPCGGVASGFYIGGAFTTVGGSATSHGIAYFNGLSWSHVAAVAPPSASSGFGGTIFGLAFFNGFLWAGGNFTSVDGNSISYLAYWDGTAWNATNTFDGEIDAMVVWGSVLVVAGQFDNISGVSGTGHVASFDGSTWTMMGYPSAAYARILGVVGSDLWVGSDSGAGNTFHKWNGSSWTAYMPGSYTQHAFSGSTSLSSSFNVTADRAIVSWTGTPVVWLSDTNRVFQINDSTNDTVLDSNSGLVLFADIGILSTGTLVASGFSTGSYDIYSYSGSYSWSAMSGNLTAHFNDVVSYGTLSVILGTFSGLGTGLRTYDPGTNSFADFIATNSEVYCALEIL